MGGSPGLAARKSALPSRGIVLMTAKFDELLLSLELFTVPATTLESTSSTAMPVVRGKGGLAAARVPRESRRPVARASMTLLAAAGVKRLLALVSFPRLPTMPPIAPSLSRGGAAVEASTLPFALRPPWDAMAERVWEMLADMFAATACTARSTRASEALFGALLEAPRAADVSAPTAPAQPCRACRELKGLAAPNSARADTWSVRLFAAASTPEGVDSAAGEMRALRATSAYATPVAPASFATNTATITVCGAVGEAPLK